LNVGATYLNVGKNSNKNSLANILKFGAFVSKICLFEVKWGGGGGVWGPPGGFVIGVEKTFRPPPCTQINKIQIRSSGTGSWVLSG